MFEVFINNEEVICESNFSINEEFMNPSSIELYKVYPKSWKGTNKLFNEYYYPQDYSKCKILKNGKLYFVGIVKNSADMQLNPFKPHYCSLQILDPSTLLSEGTTLDFVISNKSVTEGIKQVIDYISDYGFVVGNIDIPDNENTIIGAYSTIDKTPYDVFQYFALVSNSRWGTRMIDENTTAIDFYSPKIMENKGTIEVTKEYCIQNKIMDINYDFSTVDYRNKQIMTSDEIFANITYNEILISNGYLNTFKTEQKIGSIKSIVINDEEKSFATKEEKEMGLAADFYYSVSSDEINADALYPAGTNIKIEYIPLIKGRETIFNNNEITRIKTNLNRNGIISRYENRNDITSSKELLAVGKSYIEFKGIAKITLNISSKNDFLILGGKYNFNAPIAELKTSYLVKSKITKVHQTAQETRTEFIYELTNSFDTENEINYFDNQRNKVNGNITAGNFITRNIDIEKEVNIIFKNLKIKEVSINGNNILDYSLDAPFNQ